MIPQPIYLVCGVPGSGKTWVCKQLKDKFHYVPHDEYKVNLYGTELRHRASSSAKPILAEAPFRISVLIQELEELGLTVKPYFIIEPSHIVKQRYEKREGKPILKMHLTRIPTVKQRALEYNALQGTSEEVLKMLQEVSL